MLVISNEKLDDINIQLIPSRPICGGSRAPISRVIPCRPTSPLNHTGLPLDGNLRRPNILNQRRFLGLNMRRALISRSLPGICCVNSRLPSSFHLKSEVSLRTCFSTFCLVVASSSPGKSSCPKLCSPAQLNWLTLASFPGARKIIFIPKPRLWISSTSSGISAWTFSKTLALFAMGVAPPATTKRQQCFLSSVLRLPC